MIYYFIAFLFEFIFIFMVMREHVAFSWEFLLFCVLLSLPIIAIPLIFILNALYRVRKNLKKILK